jgi:hypothetical protein
MKRNITFSADDDLLDRARDQARKENRTLNDAFRDWLKVYTGQQERMSLDDIAGRWKHIKTGGPFSREELNER